MKLMLIFMVVFLVVGCATTPRPKLSTPSGRPEVTIPRVTTKQVIDRVVSRALSKGKSVIRVNDYEVVLGKKVDNTLASLLYGSRYDSTPEARTTINVVQVKDGVKAYARGEMITNPGSAFERVTELTEAAGQELQRSLEEVRDDLTPAATSAIHEKAPDIYETTTPQKTIVNNESPSNPNLFSYEAEKLAINAGCRAVDGNRPLASLIQKSTDLEIYDIGCHNQHMMVRCERNSCQLMK